MLSEEEENQWDSRKVYIMVLICQFIGMSNVNSIPSNALLQGTFGYTIFLTVFYVFMGIPILYMESVVGQFTTRDCVDAWKIRPCFSYIGYTVVLWQAVILIFNHIITSFLIHYFLISFESPVPFYTCGSWSTRFCNSIVANYTVNQDCIKYQNLFPYCDNLYKTFPEYQYWRQNLVRADYAGYKIAWKVCLASGLICFFVFIACFKRSKSLKWFVGGFAVYPMLALMVLFIGSMRQKGLVAKFEEALDLEFDNFRNKFRLSNLIHQVVFNLNIGTGVIFTLSSSTSFRTPCFSDIVIAVVFYALFTIMFVFTIAMMTCPYAFEYGVHTLAIIKTPMTLNFEKFPRLLYMYEDKTFYLIIMFSCNATLGICTSVMFFFNIVEVILKRCPKLRKYPGLTTFCAVVFMFIITIPFLSYNGVNIIAASFRLYISLFSTFIAILECSVFLILYGINKFAEDVHFMLGIKPKNCIKVSWILSTIFLTYAFVTEIYCQMVTASTYYIYATYGLLFIVSLLILVFIIRVLYATGKKKVVKYLSLDPSWGPNNVLLQRSRAMFSAQAMTKEYIYRQYSLQAGIMARQKNSNKRVCYS